MRSSRRIGRAAVVGALAVALFGCAPTPPTSGSPSPGAESPTPTASADDFAGLVELPSGRGVYLECRGEGAPTVVFVSGGGLAADEWSTLAPGSPGTPVMDAIAETNRVCAYDRPGTTRVTGDPSRSDPVEAPRTLTEMAGELDEVLVAGGEDGPYVLVAHSFGGAIGRLYAGLHPDEVEGAVWLDAGHETFYAVFEDIVGPKGYDVPGIEYSLPPTLIEMREQFAAHPMPEVPSTVIEHSCDRDAVPNPMGWDESWPIEDLEVAWRDAQDDLAALVPGTTHLVAEKSGHLIMVEEVDLVIDAIRDVLAEVG